MLRKEIKYKDFDGKDQVDICYFNMSEVEILRYQAENSGYFFQGIVDAKNLTAVMDEIEKLILLAYGVRSEDGRRFIKNSQVREEFTQTPAFNALFMELTTNEQAASDFVAGVIPAEMRGAYLAEAKASLPPPVNSTEV
jgi:hypothetical protein